MCVDSTLQNSSTDYEKPRYFKPITKFITGRLCYTIRNQCLPHFLLPVKGNLTVIRNREIISIRKGGALIFGLIPRRIPTVSRGGRLKRTVAVRRDPQTNTTKVRQGCVSSCQKENHQSFSSDGSFAVYQAAGQFETQKYYSTNVRRGQL